MNQVKAIGFTKQMARNMFYGGTVFFIFVFAALIFDSERKIPFRSNAEAITPAVIKGKGLWETRNCIGCHTLLGEGAYFAPELGNTKSEPTRNLMHFGVDMAFEMRFTRTDTGQAVLAQAHVQQVRADPRTMPLMQACLSGTATAAQRQEFAQLWQARVEQLLLVHGFDDAVFELRPA